MGLWRKILANNRLGGGLLVLLAVAILWAEYRADLQAHPPLNGGELTAVGQVRDLTVAQLRGSRSVVRMEYRFSVDSREYLGTATATLADEELPDLASFRPGRTVTVLYDPAEPGQLGWVVGFPPRIPWGQRPNVLLAGALLLVGVLFGTLPRAELPSEIKRWGS